MMGMEMSRCEEVTHTGAYGYREAVKPRGRLPSQVCIRPGSRCNMGGHPLVIQVAEGPDLQDPSVEDVSSNGEKPE